MFENGPVPIQEEEKEWWADRILRCSHNNVGYTVIIYVADTSNPPAEKRNFIYRKRSFKIALTEPDGLISLERPIPVHEEDVHLTRQSSVSSDDNVLYSIPVDISRTIYRRAEGSVVDGRGPRAAKGNRFGMVC